MTAVPTNPKIFHITPVENIPSILTDRGLWADAVMVSRGGPKVSIGMSKIKQRRLTLPVKCHPGSFVGGYVPFYFCPRSVMLFLIHKRNTDLDYKDGQTSIVHLEADLHEAVAWADAESRRWAFTLSNAGAYYTEFRDQLTQLAEINWQAVSATDFRDPQIKERKQSEFLVDEFFPWQLVQRIGVHSTPIEKKVQQLLKNSAHQPIVQVLPNWYF